MPLTPVFCDGCGERIGAQEYSGIEPDEVVGLCDDCEFEREPEGGGAGIEVPVVNMAGFLAHLGLGVAGEPRQDNRA